MKTYLITISLFLFAPLVVFATAGDVTMSDSSVINVAGINLIVSGGHTYIVLLQKKNKYKVLGATVDDAAGEAFDKVARMLRLPYPGGPEISRIARGGKKDFNFPRPMLNAKNFNFSFAGLTRNIRSIIS